LILFCGSSALVKLYLHEDGSDTTRALAAASDVLAVCRIAWFEFMSALARHQRERPQDAQAIASARKHLEADWPNYLCLEVTQELAQLAGDYADTFALRAYDAVQLAAAELARREMPGELRFACFDARLAKAARVLGIDAG
jgi:predicted nucleic acid-binding protein